MGEGPREQHEADCGDISEAGVIAEGFGERLAAEGEICWGGMHSWRRNVQLLEMVGMPNTVGFQADMAHTMLFTMGYNAPEDRLLPDDFDWSQHDRLSDAYREMARALRPLTFDFHVAQNDGTVKGSGSHDKTGRHCLPPIRTANWTSCAMPAPGCAMMPANPTKAFAAHLLGWLHVPQFRDAEAQTWNDILRVMIAVRDAHGWD